MQKARLTVFSLAMLIAGAIDSIRNLPATALFGNTLIFFFLISVILFLIPTALISSELSANYPEQSGIYHWISTAFGKRIGFLAVWLQWINTLVWYPTILSFIAATAAYLIDPQLAQNKIYLVSIILGTFWGLTWVNLRGLKTSARFAEICAVFGMIVPMTVIVIMAVIWIMSGKPLQLHLTAHEIIPDVRHFTSWISLTAIMTAFLGMELACVHTNQIENAQRNFPRALLIAVLVILTTMIAGSLAIALTLPSKDISLVSGVMQAFKNYLAAYHLTAWMPVLTIMILIGSLGGMINWVISPAKALLQTANDGFLPPLLKQVNDHGVAKFILPLQAVMVTLICLAFLLMPSINASYWLLTDLSTQLYMIMYVILFLAYWKIRWRKPKHQGFTVPGKRFSGSLLAFLGLLGCLITLLVGFFPPAGIDVGGRTHFEIVFSAGIVLMIIPVLFFIAYNSKHKTVPLKDISC